MKSYKVFFEFLVEVKAESREQAEELAKQLILDGKQELEVETISEGANDGEL